MYLINWFQANLLMAFTALILIGIPVVVLFIVFTRKSDAPPETGRSEKE